MYNFDPYYVLLAIATNIQVLLLTGFVIPGSHIIMNGYNNLHFWSLFKAFV